MVTRRQTMIFLAAGGYALPSMTGAADRSNAGKTRRVGILWHAGSIEEEGEYYKSLIEGFKELGYIDGRNIVLEHRFPNETPERFKSLAAELVSMKVDVLVAVGAVTSLHVKDATTTIPVVFVYATDPVRDKLVESLARPGGNMTGLTNLQVGLVGKRMQLFKEAIPGLARIAMPFQPTKVGQQSVEEAQAAAAKVGLKVQGFEVHTREDFAQAFGAMTKAGIQGVVTSGGLIFTQRALVAQLALSHRLPICAHNREFAEAGALISYGPDQRAMVRRAATYVDKILKGANPREIPVEQPMTLETVLNMKTSKALGIKISNSILVQATTVIE